MGQLGFDQKRCAEMLGCDKNSITKWKREGAPQYIGLACAAIIQGLEPYQGAKKPRSKP